MYGISQSGVNFQTLESGNINTYFDAPSILDQLQLFPLPIPPNIPPRPLTEDEKRRISILSELQFFLATAPTRWTQVDALPLPNLSKFQLPNGEYVSCILWNGLYHITGTDIVRALSFRFEAFGRPVKLTKKWEEGVFSDLRNLKPGTDACLEDPKSPLLDFLFRNGCIRTQKKQKVFYWFSVPHDRLFLDALERDLKREKIGQTPTTEVIGEPARSFRYDPRRSLYEQFAGQNPGMSSSIMLHDDQSATSSFEQRSASVDTQTNYSTYDRHPSALPRAHTPSAQASHTATLSSAVFEGSPTYKKRRIRNRPERSASATLHRSSMPPPHSVESSEPDDAIGMEVFRGPRQWASSEDVTAPPRSPSPALKQEDGESIYGPSDATQDSDKVYICAFEFCRRRFKRLEHLKRHIRTHTQEKPYACPQCTRSFSRQDNLVQHLRTHTRPDEYPNFDSHGHEDARSRTGCRAPTSQSDHGHVTGLDDGHMSPFTGPAHPPSMTSASGPLRPSTVPPDWPTLPATDASARHHAFANSGGPASNRRIRSVTPFPPEFVEVMPADEHQTFYPDHDAARPHNHGANMLP